MTQPGDTLPYNDGRPPSGRSKVDGAEVTAAQVIVKCRQKGLIVILSCRRGIGNVICIKPPMNIGEELVLKGLDILDQTLSEIEKQ